MSEHIVYVDRFQIREGRLADFKRYATEMAELVEENEPGALSFNYYVDEDGASGTAVFVFSDAEALDAHLDLAASRFPGGIRALERHGDRGSRAPQPSGHRIGEVVQRRPQDEVRRV